MFIYGSIYIPTPITHTYTYQIGQSGELHAIEVPHLVHVDNAIGVQVAAIKPIKCMCV